MVQIKIYCIFVDCNNRLLTNFQQKLEILRTISKNTKNIKNTINKTQWNFSWEDNENYVQSLQRVAVWTQFTESVKRANRQCGQLRYRRIHQLRSVSLSVWSEWGEAAARAALLPSLSLSHARMIRPTSPYSPRFFFAMHLFSSLLRFYAAGNRIEIENSFSRLRAKEARSRQQLQIYKIFS